MSRMELISLSDEDVAALDRHVRVAGVPSRSAAIQRAIRMLRDPALADAYAAARDGPSRIQVGEPSLTAQHRRAGPR